MIILHISKLEKEPIDLEGSFPKELLEIENTDQLRITSDVNYKIHAQLIGKNILVKGKIDYKVEGICRRCLYEMEDEVVNDNIYLLIEDPTNEEVDISQELREEAILELPMSLLCSDDCAGLCPVCGIDLNEEQCDCVIEEVEEEKESVWNALDQLDI